MSETKITDPKREHLDPVISGGATIRKKSKGQKAVESFLGEEVESVKDHIVYDMVIPSTKDALSNMFGGVVDFFNDMMHEFIDSILFGGSDVKTKASQTYVSYNGYYNKNRSRSTITTKETTRRSGRHSIDEVEFESDEKETAAEKAAKVYKDMIERIEMYNEVSVAEYFDMAGISLDWTEEREKDEWGWRDVSCIGRPRKRRGKYIIPLTRPERLREV